MGCLSFIGDVLGFGIVRKGLKSHPRLTLLSLLAFWGWAFITGAMIVRFAHLGEHPYVFEIMPIASCMSPLVALVGVLFFTIGDAFTNIFSEAFQSSFGFMPFNLYEMVGAPHPLLTWGAYIRLNLIGLMSYALLPGLMGRLFARLFKGLIGMLLPKRRKPAAVLADGPKEFDPRFVPTGGGSPIIDPPPGMKPGDIMVNMGPDRPGRIIRDGVVIQGEGLGTRVDIPGLTSPAWQPAGTGMPQPDQVMINQGPNMDGGGPLTMDAPPGSLPGDIMVNMGPDSPGQAIRNGVVIQGEGVGSRIGMPRAGEVLINQGPNMDGDGPLTMDLPPGARDGDIMVNMGPDSQGQVIRDGEVIAGEGVGSHVGMPEDDEILINRGPNMDGTDGGPAPEGGPGDTAAAIREELDARGGPAAVSGLGNTVVKTGLDGSAGGAATVAGLSNMAVKHGLDGSTLASPGTRLQDTGLGSHLAATGQASLSGLGGVLGQATGISPTVTGLGSGHMPGLTQATLAASSRADQLAHLAGLGQLAEQSQQGLADAATQAMVRHRPHGPKPGWGHEPYRPPWQPQDPTLSGHGFYPEPGDPGFGGSGWTDMIPGYLGAVVGATGGIGLGGGIYYGDMWAEYHPIREITHPSGEADPSCFKMDADYAAQNVAAGGTMSPVGGAAVIATAPPAPPPGGSTPSTPPGVPPPPTDPTIEWTSPDGRTHVLEKQPNGNYINILTGGEIDGTNIDGWKQNYNDNLQRTDDWRQRNEYLTRTGQDAQSQELARIKADGEARQNILNTVGRMERNVFEGNNGLDELLGRQGGPGDIMQNLRDIANQATGRGPIDMAKLNAAQRLYGDTISGNVISENDMPAPETFGDSVVNGGFETVKQLSTVRGPDGKFSALSLAGRIGADILTGGYAEGLFIPAESLNVAKEYVDAGGDSAVVGGFMAAGTAAVNLAGGELISRGVKAAPAIGRVGGELAEELGENVVRSAASGNSMARTAVNTANAARGAFDAYGRPVINSIKQTANELNVNLGRAPWEPPVPGRIARPPVTNAEVNARNADFINNPTANISGQVDNMPTNTRTNIQQVADEHGAIIDMRPGNELTARRINEGCHPKGPDLHNKTINQLDRDLGANANAEGLVGHYKPKLPRDFDSLPREMQEKLVDRFQQRHAEFVNNHGALSRNPKFEIREGVVYNRETGMAYTGDNDVMSVRDAITGRMASADKTNAVMDDLVSRNCGVEHNSQMTWDYRGQPTTPQGPRVEFTGTARSPGNISGEWRHSPFQQSQNIDRTIINSHQITNPNATPLVSFGPGGPPRATFINGGMLP